VILGFLKNKMANISFYLILSLPILIGLLLIAVITDIVYSGGRRESMAAKAESFLIEQSLRFAAQPAKKVGEVVVVSADESDYKFFTHVKGSSLRDLEIEEYARVVEKIASFKPSYIIVNWLHYAHKNMETDLEPFVRRLARLSNVSNIYLAFPSKLVHAVPELIKDNLKVLEANDCVYRVNSFCSYNKAWDSWMIQNLVNFFWKPIPSMHISDNLPHKTSNFLLNLPLADSMTQLNFRETLKSKQGKSIFFEKAVFVGNDLSQDSRFWQSKYLIERTFIASSKNKSDLTKFGVPFHVFWAQMAQMFIDESTVAVPSRRVGLFVLIVLAAIIVFSLMKVGPAASFGCFLLYILLYPIVNFFLLRFLGGYVPVFDMIYGGFITFICSSFIFISFTNYRSWMDHIKERHFEHTLDLKSNFISLISHNLNTPIAKLQGLVDAIILGELSEEHKLLYQTRKEIFDMLITTRSVLLLMSLDEGTAHTQALSVDKVYEDLVNSLEGNFERLQIEGEVTLLSSHESPIEYEQVQIDLRLMSHLGLCLLSLLGNDVSQVSVSLGLSDSLNSRKLVLTGRYKNIAESSRIYEVLRTPLDVDLKDRLMEEDFNFATKVSLLRETAKFYQGNLLASIDQEDMFVQIQL